MTTTPTPAAVLAATIRQLADSYAMQMADDEWNPVANPVKAAKALHAAIDQLREMAEGAQERSDHGCHWKDCPHGNECVHAARAAATQAERGPDK